jgi:hypothetical protein
MNKNQQLAIIAKTVDLNIVNFLLNQFDVPIVIITPNRKGLVFKNVEIIDDDEYLNKNKFFQKCKHPRPGWLYQQFLKYQVVIKSDFENTLIIDGDSLIRNEKFLTPYSLYYTQKNIENFYSNFITRTLGENFLLKRNYITNQMNFNKETLTSMLNKSFGTADQYPEFIMNFLQKNLDSEFSEYQTYAAWLNFQMRSSSNLIKVFRRHDLVNEDPLKSLKKYDLIAFESEHKTDLLRIIRAKILYSLGINLG